MSLIFNKYQVFLLTLFIGYITAITVPVAVGAGIPVPAFPVNSIAYPDTAAGLSLSQYRAPRIFKLKNDYLKYTFSVDSAKTRVVGKSGISSPYFTLPQVFSLSEYIQFRTRTDIQNSFRKAIVTELFKKKTETTDGALKIEIPWKVRSRTFQKIFGGDKVGLRVTGNITINGGLRRQKSDQNYTTQNDQANYSFRIDQTQRFTIEGKVGDKVSVKVDQDSERMFDFENSIKLEYTGEEDEIIQKIEAGNISLALTGTELATFSGKNTGLFGLKTESRLGPLKLTTIASVEKGQKNKKSLTGGAEETSVEIQSTNILRNKYYFINSSYRENYRYFSEAMEHQIMLGLIEPILEIEVYKSVNVGPNTINQGLLTGWAMNSPDRNNIPPDSLQDKNNIKRQFKQLTKNVDYTTDTNLGYIRLNYPLNSDEVLSCAYITANDTVGDYFINLEDSVFVFKLVRPYNPQPSDSTWNLEFKSVYSLQAVNIQKDGFEFKVLYTSGIAGSDAETQLVNGEPQTYLTILGLDRQNVNGTPEPDGILDDFPAIINWGTGELMLPGLRPFDPDPEKGGGYYINGILQIPALDSTTLMPTIYDTTDNYPTVSKYKFTVKHKSVSATYSLGYNVLEGSEEVFLNGARLKKGVDYNIDYMTGNLSITNQAASSPSANVEVLWESGEIFQLDKTTLLGVRGEYELWNPESFFGTTALYLNEKPLEERVKVGNEPTRNFVWDANSRMVFNSPFITRIFDFMPLLEAETESKVTLEGEFARVFPNPNSLNNPATGDVNGVAYLDDFESVKRVSSLGIMRKNWTLSSVPPGNSVNGTTLEQNYMRGNLLWYNPYDQIPIQQIWPDREVNSMTASNVHVLNLNFTPEVDTVLNQFSEEQSWAGVQKYLSAGSADQSKSKYLEVWIKRTGDTGATLHFDLGMISEDAVPNGQLNTEDEPLNNFSFGNGILDPGEDIGLDMMSNGDSRADSASQFWSQLDRETWDFWDLNDNRLRDDTEPWSDDGYYYSVASKNNYTHINGTENNEMDEGERLPDTEDLNYNNTLDLQEQFFRCSFTIPPPDSLLGSAVNDNGWMLVRFPLKYAESFGNPTWTQVEYTRIWIDGCNETANLQIASIELVGNEWEEVLEPALGTQAQERLAISVINTYDNIEYIGNQPPGVQGQRDPITNILSREQSLVVSVVDLPPRAIAMVKKTFYSPINFLEYNTLKMFVRGGGVDPSYFSDYEMKLFFRFGADTSSNYYEIYQTLQPDWNDSNEIILDLREIPQLKLERNALNSGLLDTTQTLTRVNPEDTTCAYRIVNGDSLIVKGNPSLSQVRQLTIGLHNTGKYHIVSEDNLEVWVDELRLSDVKRDPGTAYRASANLQLSDLGALTANLNRRDPDFHTVDQRLGSGSGNSNQSLSGNFAFDRFLPPSWGLRLPVTGNYTQTVTTPKYYPGSDILVNTEDPLALDTVRTLDQRRGWGIDISRAAKSSNPFLKYTVDNLTAGYDYNDSYGTSPTNEYNKSKTHSATLGYGLTFGSEFSFGFMGWSKNIPLLKKLKDTRFSYMPTRIQTNISGTETMTESLTRSQVYQPTRNFNLTRSFATGFRPFSVMNFDFNRTYRSNMLDYQWRDLIVNGQFGKDDNITQTFNSSYAPVIFNWLTQDMNYSANYTWSWGSGYAVSGQSVQSDRSITTSWTLKTAQIFPRKSAPGKTKGKLGTHPKAPEEPLKEKEAEKTKPGEKKKLGLLSPLKFLTSKLNDIRFDYSNRRGLSTPAVTGQADWKYQLGFSANPEISQVPGYSGTSVPTSSFSDDYKAKSGINFTQNLRTTFDYSYNTTENQSTTRSGQFVQTQYYMFKKGAIKHFPFLNLSLRLTGLEKTALLQKWTQTVSLESAFSGKSTSRWTTEKNNINEVNYDRNFSPLMGINISWKGGISSNIKYSVTQNLSDKIQIGQKSRSNNTSISITGNYTRKTGFRIPIPIWPFNNKRFSNNTTFSLTFTSSNRVEESLNGDATSFNVTSKTKQWSVMPKMDYTFSNTVVGGIHYEMGATENSLSGKTSFHEFGFNVNISIRGK